MDGTLSGISQDWRRFMLASFAMTLLAPMAWAQPDPIEITFQLHAPQLPDQTDVYITGSVEKLGNWNPGKIRMKAIGSHQWSYRIQSRSGFPIEYKYTLGSWARENADGDGNPLKNFAIHPDRDVVIKDRVASWTTGKQRKIRGQITGDVRYHRQMSFDGLLPRDIIVWLPPGYDESTQRFPVLYMHDGQNVIDPATSSFGVDWQVDETLTRLIAAGKCRPLMVVGIYNTRERGQDYTPGAQGDRYAEFVCRKLKPFIDANYKTDASRQATAIAGSSAGGICAFRMAWEHPDIFSMAICMSPAFEYRRPDGSYRVSYVDQFASSRQPEPLPFFYIDNGGIGLEKILQPGIDRMLKEFKSRNMKEDRDYVCKVFPEDRHDEEAWGKRMPAVLERLFSK